MIGSFILSSAKTSCDGDECGFCVERVENGFNQQQVHAARDQRAHLAAIVGFALIEGDDAETGIVRVGRDGERNGERADGTRDIAAAAGGVRDAVGPFATFTGRGVVDVAGQFLQELVLDDGLVERGILAATVFARIRDEELALADGGGGKGVGLDDVRAGLEEAPVDVADLGGPGERVDVAVVLEVLRGVLEALAARILFPSNCRSGWWCPWRRR